MSDRNRIRVAVAGVGNCTCSLVQGPVAYADGADGRPGLAHPLIGPYAVSDIEFVAAFDVDDRKVGLDLADAIFAPPNCTTSYVTVPPTGVIVQRGPLLDGLSDHVAADIPVSDAEPAAVAAVLRDSGADVLVCELPVGSAKATAFYAGAALEAGVAFVNCNPERIANDADWRARFAEAGVPLFGDDIKSQLGTTVVHRTLLELIERRGLTVDRSYQLNYGGNNDFLNMVDRNRFDSKRHSKLGAISTSVTGDGAEISLVPVDFIHYLGDDKIAYVHIDASAFLGMKASIELRLTVEDSPNASGVVVDAIRVAKIALDRGAGGYVDGVGSAFFKNPPDIVPEAQTGGVVPNYLAAK